MIHALSPSASGDPAHPGTDLTLANAGGTLRALSQGINEMRVRLASFWQPRSLPLPPAAPGRLAGDSCDVLINYRRNSDSELQAATQLADNPCQLFARRSAVLESINPRGDDIARATYLCR